MSMLFVLVLMTVPVLATDTSTTTASTVPKNTAPPILDDEADTNQDTSVSTTQATTAADIKAAGQGDQPPVEQQPAGQADGDGGAMSGGTYLLVFAGFMVAIGGLAGYVIRGFIEKRKYYEYDEDEADENAAEYDEDDYNVDHEPVIIKTAKEESQASKRPSPRMQEQLEPVDVDYYNRPYYYDEDGMPYYHDPTTGEPVYYHEEEQDETYEDD